MEQAVRTARHVRRNVVLFALLAPLQGFAANYYVAPKGSDAAAGTEGEPFATVGRAQTVATAGDTVFIRGGTFAFSGTGTVGVSFTKSGQANSLIKYFAYPGEIPIFDLTNLTPGGRVTGLDVHCNYIHLRGLEVLGVHQYQSGQDSWGVRIQGSNNILENLDVHNNDAPGIFITSGADNLILNCDSHHNYDVLESGGSGDGFGCHASGGGNVLRGCRSYDNSDDGFDFINASGSCTVEQSVSFRNGYVPGTTTAAGNGAGFKAGGYGSPPSVPTTGAATHTVRQCVAFGNRAQGFYANHHPGQINFLNNTAFNNPVNYNMLADSGYPSSHVLRNNVAMASGTAISNLTGGTDSFNSWSLSVTVSTADFVSVDQAEALTARTADGSLPSIGFLHLVADSDLIDKGTDVGLPYSGAAPDLGAFEYGATAGGATSTGGTASVAGAANAGGGALAGGATSTGGTKASGGGTAANRGGSPNTGGAKASAGATNAGGGVGNGGTLGIGGTLGGFGGSATVGGGKPAGGNTAQGGMVATAGGAVAAGAVATDNGGNAALGGAPENGGTTTTLGNVGIGGATNPANAGATSSSGPLDAPNASGCGCRVPHSMRTSSDRGVSLVLLGLLLGRALRRRRRSRLRAFTCPAILRRRSKGRGQTRGPSGA
jgi:parallel beta-helix repeat protein